MFGSGADLQLLAVGRRSEAETVDLDASSIAGKYRAVVGDNELELMAANHYGGQVYGLGLRVPAGGAGCAPTLLGRWTTTRSSSQAC